MIRINGFQWAHLLRWQFWWMFGAAALTTFTRRRYMIGKPDGSSYLEVSRHGTPDPMLWDAGYGVSVCAHLFGARVFRHEEAYSRPGS